MARAVPNPDEPDVGAEPSYLHGILSVPCSWLADEDLIFMTYPSSHLLIQSWFSTQSLSTRVLAGKMVAFCDVDIPGGVELFPGKNGENTSRKENACCDGIGDNQASELAGQSFPKGIEQTPDFMDGGKCVGLIQ